MTNRLKFVTIKQLKYSKNHLVPKGRYCRYYIHCQYQAR